MTETYTPTVRPSKVNTVTVDKNQGALNLDDIRQFVVHNKNKSSFVNGMHSQSATVLKTSVTKTRQSKQERRQKMQQIFNKTAEAIESAVK